MARFEDAADLGFDPTSRARRFVEGGGCEMTQLTMPRGSILRLTQTVQTGGATLGARRTLPLKSRRTPC